MNRGVSAVILATGLSITAAVFAVSAVSIRSDPPPHPAGAAAPPVTTTAGAPTTTVAAVSTVAPAVASTSPGLVGGTWAGRLDGHGGTLAIVVAGDRAIAYYCNGRNVEVWLRGAADRGLLALAGRPGTAVTGTYGDGEANGVVRAGGPLRTFLVPGAAAPAGLYRLRAPAAGRRLTGTWIVLPDGSQTGVVTVAGRARPAPPLELVHRTVRLDGRTLPVDPVLPGN